jgi:hypothetical protein
MTCASCIAAEQYPTRTEFAPDCIGCKARALATTRGDLLPNYREAAKRLFGDQVKESHEQVKHWLAAMRQQKARAV